MTTDNQRDDGRDDDVKCTCGHERREHGKRFGATCYAWDAITNFVCRCLTFQPSDEGRGAAAHAQVRCLCKHARIDHEGYFSDGACGDPNNEGCECLRFQEEHVLDKPPPATPEPAVGVDRYSDDRLSLAQEIAETLKSRGHWVPANYAGPDLIMAVGKALDAMPPTETAKGGEGANEHAARCDGCGDPVAPYRLYYCEPCVTPDENDMRVSTLRDEITRLERERDTALANNDDCRLLWQEATDRADRLAAELADTKRECSMLIEGCFNADAKLAEAKAALVANRLTISEANNATEEQREEKRQLQAKLAEVTKDAERLRNRVAGAESHAGDADRAIFSWSQAHQELRLALDEATKQQKADYQRAVNAEKAQTHAGKVNYELNQRLTVALAREAGLRSALETFVTAPVAVVGRRGMEYKTESGMVIGLARWILDEDLQRAGAALSASPEGVAEVLRKMPHLENSVGGVNALAEVNERHPIDDCIELGGKCALDRAMGGAKA